MVLFKMLNRGVFHDINGCISTGKEVSVVKSLIYYGILFYRSYCCSNIIVSLFFYRQMYIMQQKQMEKNLL